MNKFNGNWSMKFCTCKKTTMKKKSFSLKFSNSFQVVKFISNVLKHLLIYYVIIMMKIVNFLSCKMFKINKKMVNCCKIEVLNQFL